MNAIAGVILFDRHPGVLDTLDLVSNATTAGQPMHITRWSDHVAGLTHLTSSRLSTTRENAQPLHNTDGSCVIVCDAAIENRDELSVQLGIGGNSRLLDDSAFVLNAYEKWGESCPRYLDGRFAFAVWNRREQRLFCAVDQFAFRPLYYSQMGARLVFGSTLRGVLAAPEISGVIDDNILADYFCHTRTCPGQTLYRDVRSIPPAHSLVVDSRGCSLRCYWGPDNNRELRFDSDEDYVEAFKFEFERAVSAGIQVQGNIGIRISGGLDSAATTAVAGQLLAKQGRRLQAIHELPASPDPRYDRLRVHDESRYVRLIEQQSPHIDFHYVRDSEQKDVSLDGWRRAFDVHRVPLRGYVFEPSRPSSPIDDGVPEIRRSLSGLAGNYIVSLEAYPSVYLAQLAAQLQWRSLSRELLGLRRVYGYSIRNLIGRMLESIWPPRSAAGNRGTFCQYLNPDFVRRTAIPDRIASLPIGRWDRKNFNVREMSAWIMTHLMSQSVGVAPSVIIPGATCDTYSPFFSRRLNEFCMAVPIQQQIHNGWDRLLLRRSMQGVLPNEVIWRTTRGLPLPSIWTRTRALWKQLPEIVPALEKSTLVQSYLDVSRIRRDLLHTGDAAIRNISPVHARDLFNVGWFLNWLEDKTRSATVVRR